jgi:hypothetical protein
MQNHYANGIRAFWLDADEGSGGVGESTPLPRSDSTFSAGSVDEVGLMYPYFHQQAMHDAMAAQVPSPVGPNGTGILTLSRSAWLGSSRWGAAVSLFLTSHSSCPQTNATAGAVRRSARCSPRAPCLAQRTHHSACAGSAARASFSRSVWSGDTDATWDELRRQVRSGDHRSNMPKRAILRQDTSLSYCDCSPCCTMGLRRSAHRLWQVCAVVKRGVV